jgi:CubicO group peptidase (beta-lactamase class C family)
VLRSIVRTALLPACGIPALAAAARAAQPPATPPNAARPSGAAVARAVDSLAAEAVRAGLAPALGVALAMDGRTAYARSHGLADVTARVPADARTLWYLASTSKSLTGFGVALLAHRGAVRLDAPITTLLPDARWHPAVRADSLTLAHFLSHTHGVDDRAVVQSAAFTGAVPEARWPALLALAGPMPTRDLVYTNLGYNVAGMVIDRVQPGGWRRYLAGAVYAPAGMRETYARVSGLDPRRLARAHRLLADGGYRTEPFFKTDATMSAAGGHLATLDDLARWAIVQMDSGVIDGRRVFPAAAVALGHRLLARQTRPQARRFAFFDRDGWAAGWDVGAYEGEPMVSRFGSYHSTRSHLSFLPRRRIGVVAMSSGGLSAVTDVIAAFAYDLEAGRPDAHARAAARMAELRTRLAAARRNVATRDSLRAARGRQPLGRPLADFAGRYHEPAFGTVEITAHEGRLAYRWGALYGPAEVHDAAGAEWRIEEAGSGEIVRFAFDGPGPARALTLEGTTFARVR